MHEMQDCDTAAKAHRVGADTSVLKQEDAVQEEDIICEGIKRWTQGHVERGIDGRGEGCARLICIQAVEHDALQMLTIRRVRNRWLTDAARARVVILLVLHDQFNSPLMHNRGLGLKRHQSRKRWCRADLPDELRVLKAAGSAHCRL